MPYAVLVVSHGSSGFVLREHQVGRMYFLSIPFPAGGPLYLQLRRSTLVVM